MAPDATLTRRDLGADTVRMVSGSRATGTGSLNSSKHARPIRAS
jgi:hypothetical protein